MEKTQIKNATISEKNNAHTNNLIISHLRLLFFVLFFLFFFVSSSFAQEQRNSSLEAKLQYQSTGAPDKAESSSGLKTEFESSGSGLFLEATLFVNPVIDLLFTLDRASDTGSVMVGRERRLSRGARGVLELIPLGGYDVESDSRTTLAGIRYYFQSEEIRESNLEVTFFNIERSKKRKNYTPASFWRVQEAVVNGDGSGNGVEGNIYLNPKVDLILTYITASITDKNESDPRDSSLPIETSDTKTDITAFGGGATIYFEKGITRKNKLEVVFSFLDFTEEEGNYRNSPIEKSTTEQDGTSVFIEYNHELKPNLDLVLSSNINTYINENSSRRTDGTTESSIGESGFVNFGIGVEYYFGQ